MSTQTEITRLQEARNKIRTWEVGLGIATSTDKLDELATKAAAIKNQGAVDANVKEGETYTIPQVITMVVVLLKVLRVVVTTPFKQRKLLLLKNNSQ